MNRALAGYPETGLGWPDAMAPSAQVVPGGGGDRRQGGRPREPGQAPLEAGLGFQLGRAHRMVRATWEDAIADLRVTPPQAALLRAVAQRPDCGLRELARRMGTDAMNAKRLADHLEQSGLVSSVPDPGHRQRRVLQATVEGAALARELARRAAAHQRRLESLAGRAGVTRLQALLDHLESALAAAPLPGPARREAQGRHGARRTADDRRLWTDRSGCALTDLGPGWPCGNPGW